MVGLPSSPLGAWMPKKWSRHASVCAEAPSFLSLATDAPSLRAFSPLYPDPWPLSSQEAGPRLTYTPVCREKHAGPHNSEAQHHASIGRSFGPSEDGDAVGKGKRGDALTGAGGLCSAGSVSMHRTEGSDCCRSERIKGKPGAPW